MSRAATAARPVATAPPRALLDALDGLDDAAALIDRETADVVGATAAMWRFFGDHGGHGDRRDSGDPGNHVGHSLPVALERWDGALPGLAHGLHEGLKPLPSRVTRRGQHGPPWRWSVADGDVVAEAAVVDTRWVVLRLSDEGRCQREQREALRRQLHDRESLLFTSRSLSVGEVGSVLAHELKQPIGAVSNVLRGLRLRLRVSRRAETDEGAGEELVALERAIDQVAFASQVITRIREFTHARVPRFERLELGELLRTSSSLLDWDWQRQGVRFALDLPGEAIHTHGDATMLQQVVANLLRNALDAMREYPPVAPHVTVSLRREKDEAVIGIADNGMGMSIEAEKRLFVPFTSAKPTGLGIGLSICRSFVELHQGRLWFARNEDAGCTFFFRLPIDASDAGGGTVPKGEQG